MTKNTLQPPKWPLGCVCLEVKQGRWKTLKKKWEEKLFWSVFGWMGRKENKWWDRGVFSPDPPKSFLSKMERKLKGEIRHHFWTKMPMYNCTFTHVALIFFLRCLPLFFFFLLFRCVFFFFWTWILFFNKFRWLIFFFFGCLSLFGF